jgi:DNA-binding transcriptional MerR regulator
MATQIEESLITVGQLADMLGCSVRSIYRWEESGVIPKPQRIDRGNVSARVYTETEVEQIRKKLHGRLTFTALVRDVPVRHRQANPERKVMRRKQSQRGIVDEINVDPQYAPLFMRALRYARKHGGCRTVTVVIETNDGELKTFSERQK